MTEKEWLECAIPNNILNFCYGKVSERKLRLFATGCCRNVWNFITEADARQAVEVGEQFADGQATTKQMDSAKKKALAAYKKMAASMRSVPDQRRFRLAEQRSIAIGSTVSVCEKNAESAAFRTKLALVEGRARQADKDREEAHQCRLLREIIGNPFRKARMKKPWSTPTVLTLALSIYDERAFDRLPILADALEEAGCDNADILTHCRSEGPHAKGCCDV